MGFIFYAQSPRYVGTDFQMPEIPYPIKKVGVFVNEKSQVIISKVEKYKLDSVQLHGQESEEFCKNLSKDVQLIKAFGVDEDFDFSTIEKYSPFCDYFLFDTKTAGHGGSGSKFDWAILERYKGQKPFFLSGGIGLEDVAGIRHLTKSGHKMHAIDVNSKFEPAPGLKDIHKLQLLTHELSG
jgi:phosphoribosylanthranilate isomerase